MRIPLILLAAAPALMFAAGCARDKKPDAKAQYRTHEQAFVLIDEGKRFESESAPLLALERYNRAALIYESPAAYYSMGELFEANDETEKAATAYEQALALAPDYNEARYAMLSLGYTPPDYTPTAEDLAIAADLARKREAARAMRLAQGATTATAGPSEAELAAMRESAIAEAGARRMPTQAEVEAVIFAPEAVRGDLPSAVSPTYSANTDIILGTYQYHLTKARQLQARGQTLSAEEEFQRALEADPAQIDARLELGDMLLRGERTERALYQYRRAMEDFPNSPRPYHKLGNYYLDINRPEDARANYRLALEKDPNYLEAYNNLAVLDMREAKYDSARQLLDELIKLDPTYANAYLNRGIIASDVDRDREKALDSFRRYVELGGARAAEARRWIRELQAQPN